MANIQKFSRLLMSETTHVEKRRSRNSTYCCETVTSNVRSSFITLVIMFGIQHWKDVPIHSLTIGHIALTKLHTSPIIQTT